MSDEPKKLKLSGEMRIIPINPTTGEAEVEPLEPTKKSEEINALIRSVMGKDRETTIRDRKCMTCGRSALEFRDALSEKEYTISGMCQDCQDFTYGV